MPNTYFQFQQFKINQEKSGMKVTTDACLFGAWVADQLHQHEPARILDIGTGTGLLSLMLAQNTKEALVRAVEINESAFQEAQANFRNSPRNERLYVFHQPIQEHLNEQEYDLIICNPPFFKGSQIGSNDGKNQALHSSHLAMEDLLRSVLELLSRSGSFYLLYPEMEMNQFIELAKRSGLFPTQMVTVRNKKGDLTFRKMGKFESNKSNLKESEIIIRKENGKYTDKFWELLREYYLEYNDPNK